MNVIRSIISVFLTLLLAVSAAGWNWVGGLPSPKMEGARFVLGVCAFCSVGCLVMIWRHKQPIPVAISEQRA